MKSKIQLICIVAACAFIFASCKSNPKTGAPQEGAKTESSSAQTLSGTGKYSIKSGKVTMKTELPGMGSSTAILYFDDYGNKEMREATTSFSMGGKSVNKTSRTIIRDGWIYNWVVGEKTGNKLKLDQKFDPSNINYKELTEEMKNKFKMKEEGTETIMGKTCKVFSFEIESMKGKTWVWENIPMKSEINAMGRTIVSQVTDLQENIPIPAADLDIPADVQFKEVQMPKMPA